MSVLSLQVNARDKEGVRVIFLLIYLLHLLNFIGSITLPISWWASCLFVHVACFFYTFKHAILVTETSIA